MKQKSILIRLFVIAVVALTAMSCQKQNDKLASASQANIESSRAGQLNRKSSDADDKACEACHPDIYKTFKATGMGRSFYPPTVQNAVEDYAEKNHIYDAKQNLHYEMVQRNGAFYQVEYRTDEKGHRIHEYARKVEYIIGSGNNTRTYVTADSNFFYEMPVTWYARKKVWGLSPGYDQHNFRFSRPISQFCMNCHNGYADYVPNSENQFRGNLPHGIGCERCHGRGERHIEKQYDDEKSVAGHPDTTIINPKRMSATQQLNVCMQCHLQGDIDVVKDGLTRTEIQPDQPVSKTKNIFVREKAKDGDFGIASHAARMTLSSCFLKSDGKLLCTTCHNPHESVHVKMRSAYNEKCMDCHNPINLSQKKLTVQHNKNKDCVSCHMRQGAAADVPHVNFTDHWIRRQVPVIPKPSSERADHKKEVLTLRRFFTEPDSLADINLGIAYVQYYEAITDNPIYLERAVPMLEQGLQKTPQHQDALYHLGLAYKNQKRFADAQRCFQTLTTLAPRNALAQFQLALMYDVQGELDQAASTYQNSLSIFADDIKAQLNLAVIYAKQGRLSEAIKMGERAASIQPNHAEAYNTLGGIYFYRLSDTASAKKQFEKALQLDPTLVDALNNLGNVYLKSANPALAQKQYEQILKLNPDCVPAYGNLAIIYSQSGQTKKAVDCLNQILKIEPQNKMALEMKKQMSARQ